MFNLIEELFDFLSSGLLGLVPFSMQGRKWKLIKGDIDPNPSFPHLHAVEDHRYKIDIYTGIVYKNKREKGKLIKEEFVKLWNDEKFISDVKEIRQTYIHGEYKLPPIPEINKIA